jgi:hypothetical protein
MIDGQLHTESAEIIRTREGIQIKDNQRSINCLRELRNS